MNSPKIRFKGYTEDWEQRKFDDVYCSKMRVSSTASTSASICLSVEYEDCSSRSMDWLRIKNSLKEGKVWNYIDGSQVLLWKASPIYA